MKLRSGREYICKGTTTFDESEQQQQTIQTSSERASIESVTNQPPTFQTSTKRSIGLLQMYAQWCGKEIRNSPSILGVTGGLYSLHQLYWTYYDHRNEKLNVSNFSE